MPRRLLPVALLFLPLAAHADESAFHAGTVIPEFGHVASIDSEMPIPDSAVFRIRYDVREQAEAGAVSRRFETPARFLNMHGENGVPLENMELAIVVHGGAVKDLTLPKRYKELTGAENANAPLIAALVDKGVKIYVCGQSAAYYDVANEDLMPGVTMALSAMTAHALLDAEDYVLNPF